MIDITKQEAPWGVIGDSMHKVIVTYPSKTDSYPSRQLVVFEGDMDQCKKFFQFVFDGHYEIPAGFVEIN